MNKILNIKNFGDAHTAWIKLKEQYPRAIYVGRPNKNYGLAGSPLANPNWLEREEDRAENIAQYRVWLWGKIKQGDQRVIQALESIGPDDELVCYCAPLPCHSEVVARAAEWLRRQKA